MFLWCSWLVSLPMRKMGLKYAQIFYFSTSLVISKTWESGFRAYLLCSLVRSFVISFSRDWLIQFLWNFAQRWITINPRTWRILGEISAKKTSKNGLFGLFDSKNASLSIRTTIHKHRSIFLTKLLHFLTNVFSLHMKS